MSRKQLYILLSIYFVYMVAMIAYFFQFANFQIPQGLEGTVVDPNTFMSADQIAQSNVFSKLQWVLFFIVPPLEWLFYITVIGFGISQYFEAASSKHLYGFRTISYVLKISLLAFIIFLPIKFLVYRLSFLFGISNQSTISWVKDKSIDFLVVLAFTTITSLVIIKLFRRYGSRWWFYAWMISVPITIFTMFLQPVIIDPLYNDFSTIKDKQLEGEILALAHSANIPAKHVYEVNMSEKTNALNAYVTGIGRTSRIVLWDTTLEELTKEETLFVVAHEIGHYVHRDVAKGAAMGLVVSFVGLAIIGTASSGFYNRYVKNNSSGSLKELQILPFVLLMSSILSFLGNPIENTFSRLQERRADEFAVETVHNPDAGISAFQKLTTSGLSTVEQPKIVKIFKNSHPTIYERIQYLDSK